MISFFNKKKIKFGNLYAVQAGDYVGQFFMFIEHRDDEYGFISIPSMENRIVDKEKFEFALKESIIEYVERVPRYVRDLARIKYQENSNFVSDTQ